MGEGGALLTGKVTISALMVPLGRSRYSAEVAGGAAPVVDTVTNPTEGHQRRGGLVV